MRSWRQVTCGIPAFLQCCLLHGKPRQVTLFWDTGMQAKVMMANCCIWIIVLALLRPFRSTANLSRFLAIFRNGIGLFSFAVTLKIQQDLVNGHNDTEFASKFSYSVLTMMTVCLLIDLYSVVRAAEGTVHYFKKKMRRRSQRSDRKKHQLHSLDGPRLACHLDYGNATSPSLDSCAKYLTGPELLVAVDGSEMLGASTGSADRLAADRNACTSVRIQLLDAARNMPTGSDPCRSQYHFPASELTMFGAPAPSEPPFVVRSMAAAASSSEHLHSAIPVSMAGSADSPPSAQPDPNSRPYKPHEPPPRPSKRCIVGLDEDARSLRPLDRGADSCHNDPPAARNVTPPPAQPRPLDRPRPVAPQPQPPAGATDAPRPVAKLSMLDLSGDTASCGLSSTPGKGCSNMPATSVQKPDPMPQLQQGVSPRPHIQVGARSEDTQVRSEANRGPTDLLSGPTDHKIIAFIYA